MVIKNGALCSTHSTMLNVKRSEDHKPSARSATCVRQETVRHRAFNHIPESAAPQCTSPASEPAGP